VTNQYVIGSAYRTLRILLAFGAVPHRFTLAEIVSSSGLEKSRVYRSLKTLEAAGFIVQGDDGRYELTRVIHFLSAAVERGRDASLVEVAAPYLDELAVTTGESVHLGALVGDHTVVLDRRESPAKVRLASVVLGQSVPLHAGAVPKAILAYVDDATCQSVLDNLANLPKYAHGTCRDADALRAELDAIRQRGYSISDGDFDASARGAGAPIFGADGIVVGGVSVGGPSFRVSAERLQAFGAMVRRAAAAISMELGFGGHATPDPAPLAPLDTVQ